MSSFRTTIRYFASVANCLNANFTPLAMGKKIAGLHSTRRLPAVSLCFGWGLVVLMSVFLTSCGGGGGSSNGTGEGSQSSLSSISLSPASVTLIAGQTQQITATGKYSDGTTRDISSSVTWTTSNSSIATVSVGGLVTTVTAGQASISAAMSGVSNADSVTVNPKVLQSISVSPATANLAIGISEQYEAIGTYNDGSIADLTSGVSWSSSSTSTAAITGQGFVTTSAQGTTSISATVGNIEGSAPLTVGSSIGGATLVDDMTDSRLFIATNSDQSTLTFLGTRDSTGNPTSLYGIKRAAPDGSWQTLFLDAQGRPTTITMSDNSQFLFNWISDTSVIVTGISGDGTANVAIPIGSSAIAANASGKAAVRRSSLASSSTDPASQVTVNVTTCGVPEAFAEVAVSPGFIDAYLVAPGTYQANVASGSLGNALNAVSTAASKLPAGFCKSMNSFNTFLSEGAPNPVNALTLQAAICAGVTSAGLAFPPAEVLAPAACSTLATLLTQSLSQSCTISNGTNGGFNSIVEMYENSTTVQVEAWLIGEQGVSQPVTPSISSGYPKVNIELPCPNVDHVTVTPPSSGMIVGGNEGLIANAYNNNSPPTILRSSAFTFVWNDIPAQGVASVSKALNIFGGSVALIEGVGQGGPVSISATETSSAKQGSAQVTVSNIMGLWNGSYTWDQPNGTTVQFGLDIGLNTAALCFSDPFCAGVYYSDVGSQSFQIQGNEIMISTLPVGADPATTEFFTINATVSNGSSQPTITGIICDVNNANWGLLCGSLSLTYANPQPQQ